MKKLFFLTAVGICATGIGLATSITTFGTIPGNPNGGNPYSGSGIPYNASEVTTISGLPSSDALTLALSATAHGSSNPSPGNNGNGTFYVNTGLVGGRSVWNFDFYIGSANGSLSPYTFLLTETGNNQTFAFSPLLIPDNVGAPGSAGNSESLDFSVFGVPIGYNANQNDTYGFELDALLNGTVVGSSSITVVAGTGSPTPDNTSTFGLFAASIGALCVIKRKVAKNA